MKVLITGISGYLGQVLLPYLLQDEEINSIIGLDINEPLLEHPKLSFEKVDIRVRGISSHFEDVDVVIHLAFIVVDKKKMVRKLIYDINVNGTKNLLMAVSESGIKKLVVASSIAAYGSHADNPELITENTPLRGNKDSYYSHTKLLIEKALDEFEKENKNIKVVRLRSSVLCGRNVNNPLADFPKYKRLLYIKGNTVGLPIVHEDDVARAFYWVTKKDVSGAFNIASGNLSIQEMSEMLNVPVMAVPYFIAKTFGHLLFKIGKFPFSADWIVLGRYPWRVSSEKAKNILGWYPKYTPVDAFKEVLDKWKNK
ncbi:MAG: NAD-dependent epimerase/dehydratase family protein [Chloroflexi bacterium]|nr:NAD-dependent epimerase/dehydratase family protein [Chloroflexota bacterium]